MEFEDETLSKIPSAPRPHGHPETGAEYGVERAVAAEAAEVVDDGDGRVGLRKERAGAFQPDGEEFLVCRVPHRLAETQVEGAARDDPPQLLLQTVDDTGDRDAVASLGTDDFHRPEYPRLVPPAT